MKDEVGMAESKQYCMDNHIHYTSLRLLLKFYLLWVINVFILYYIIIMHGKSTDSMIVDMYM